MKFELGASDDDKPIIPTNEELLNRGLPKWPQMKVKGKSVSPEQALEIIRKTDQFFQGWGGNDRDFREHWLRAFRVPQHDDFENKSLDGKGNMDYEAYTAAQEKWRQGWGYIGDQLEYVGNSWIASCFIGGPHGWCDMMGDIEFGYNVGKWPSVEAILRDWQTIAREFPFLDLGVVLMDGEYCEDLSTPIVGMKVFDGKVELKDPRFYDLKTEYGAEPVVKDAAKSFIMSFSMGHAREHGIPQHVLQRWAANFNGHTYDEPNLGRTMG